MHSPLVTAEWLAAQLPTGNVIVLEAFIANIIGREPVLYDAPLCIPGALKVDIDKDLSADIPGEVHPFPGAAHIATLAQALGLSKKSHIVIYDNQGIYAAPRAWWIFKSAGFENVFLLDGGLPAWREQGYAVAKTYGAAQPLKQAEEFNLNNAMLCPRDAVLANISRPQFTLLDARGAARFNGEVPEPRPGLRSGHVPGSLNLPFAAVLNGHSYKTLDELKAIFHNLGLNPAQPVVASCGSGLTACIILVAALIAGFQQASLYDGSWAQWGADASLPIA